jgi:hypothetical protein
MKCNKTQDKWCKNKHGASKIIDTFEMYQRAMSGGGPSGHTPWWHDLGVARATTRCGWLLVHLLLSFGLRLCVSN